MLVIEGFGFMMHSQPVAVKTNLLGWATTTINGGAEMAVAHRQTVQVFGALNPWTFSGERRARFWAAQPEWRYWLCERFNGHFFGIHAMGGEYNVKNIDVPFGILPETEHGQSTGTSRHRSVWATSTRPTSSTGVATVASTATTATMSALQKPH